MPMLELVLRWALGALHTAAAEDWSLRLSLPRKWQKRELGAH